MSQAFITRASMSKADVEARFVALGWLPSGEHSASGNAIFRSPTGLTEVWVYDVLRCSDGNDRPAFEFDLDGERSSESIDEHSDLADAIGSWCSTDGDEYGQLVYW